MESRMQSAQVGLGETPVKNKSIGDECNEAVTKRQDYLMWNDYFMAVASLSAQRSKDPSTQVGACIVSEDNKIVGIGYNGMPIGCSDDQLPWAKQASSVLDTKYPFVCHAEMNAIMNKNSAEVKGCTLYSTLFPCNECAKLIIQAGIKRVIYMDDKPDKDEMKASKIMFDQVAINYSQFISDRQSVEINLQPKQTLNHLVHKMTLE